MSDSIPCPCCGVFLLKPLWPSIETTTWSDDCACSDMVTCVFHRVGGDLPQRPSHEAMRARAEQRYQVELERFHQKRARFAACYPDDPEMDATDGAHPAWWRGHDYVSAKFREALNEARARSQACETLLAEIGDHLITQPDEDRQKADYREIIALLGLKCLICDQLPCACNK